MSRVIPGAADRFDQLDMLRGVAAMVVVLNHYMQTVPEDVRLLVQYPGGILNPEAWLTPWPWLRASPLRLLVAGQAAVDLFFVLSGFVLMLGVTPARQPDGWAFLAKRLCRVYLPFAAVLLLTALAYGLWPPSPGPGDSAWMAQVTRDAAAGLSRLPSHLLMTGEDADMRLNPVMWTLIHELRISLLMPLLFLGMRRLGALPVLLGSVALSLAVSPGMTDSISGSWRASLHFLWMFVLGMSLAWHRHAVTARVGSLSRPRLGAALLLALGLMALPFARVWADFGIALGAALLIALALHPGAGRRLRGLPALRWLGRVSYSLYLVHLPLLVLLAPLLPVPAVLLLSLLAAQLTYWLVEKPAHRLGLLAGRRGAVAAPGGLAQPPVRQHPARGRAAG